MWYCYVIYVVFYCVCCEYLLYFRNGNSIWYCYGTRVCPIFESYYAIRVCPIKYCSMLCDVGILCFNISFELFKWNTEVNENWNWISEFVCFWVKKTKKWKNEKMFQKYEFSKIQIFFFFWFDKHFFHIFSVSNFENIWFFLNFQFDILNFWKDLFYFLNF